MVNRSRSYRAPDQGALTESLGYLDHSPAVTCVLKLSRDEGDLRLVYANPQFSVKETGFETTAGLTSRRSS
jgi:hypothetical protein